MKIREANSIDSASRFDVAAAEETLQELELLYATGAVEAHAYFEKKRSLVKLFVKATTSPKRRQHDDDEFL